MTRIVVVNNEEDWHKIRSTVITGTQSPSIFGLNKYRSVNKMLQDRISNDFKGNSYTYIGQAMEPLVVEFTNYMMSTDFKLYEVQENVKTFYIKDSLKLGATPDASDGSRMLECKTTGPHNFLMWAYGPPVHYLMQLYVQMFCASMSEGLLSIISTNLSQSGPALKLPIHIFKIERDLEIDNLIIEEMERFNKCQEEGKMFRVKSAVKKRLLWHFKMNTKKEF